MRFNREGVSSTHVDVSSADYEAISPAGNVVPRNYEARFQCYGLRRVEYNGLPVHETWCHSVSKSCRKQKRGTDEQCGKVAKLNYERVSDASLLVGLSLYPSQK